VLFVFYAFFCLVILASYTANLTSEGAAPGRQRGRLRLRLLPAAFCIRAQRGMLMETRHAHLRRCRPQATWWPSCQYSVFLPLQCYLIPP
jgi:hypothetical protein